MTTNELFQIAIGPIAPWIVTRSEFAQVDSDQELHLYLDFVAGTTFADSSGAMCKAHDSQEHTWRHLNFFQYHCYLHTRVPRIRDSTGKVVKVQVPWADKNNGFTLLMVSFIMVLIKSEMPISKVAKLLEVYDQRIWSVFHKCVDAAISNTLLGKIENLAIDETSSKRGHDYVTIAVDMRTRTIVDVVDGKSAASVGQIAQNLHNRGLQTDEVKHVSIDMSPAFICGARESFPGAEVVFDRFHIVKIVNEALDTVRKLEQVECKMLKGYKYSLVRNAENISDVRYNEMIEKLKLYPRLGEAYRMKELLREFWNYNNVAEAENFLKSWCTEALEQHIEPFNKVVAMIKSHWSGIMKSMETKISNGILEGINSKVQLAKRRARGYRNKENFKKMIMFIGGKLNFSEQGYSIH